MSGEVLPFPQTERALRHRRTGMSAAGLLSLLLLDREGDSLPANVERFDQLDEADVPKKSPEMLLALLLWANLPAKKRENIKSAIRCAAYGSQPDFCAVQLHNLLKRKNDAQR